MTKRLVYARARPDKVEVIETYEYFQEISRNSLYPSEFVPYGALKIVVSYDGSTSFPPIAYEDVRHQLDPYGPDEPMDALIGHLVFSNHQRTSLSKVLDLRGQLNSVPIRIPVVGPELPSLEDLNRDCKAAVLETKYGVQKPQVRPISVDVQLRDESILDQISADALPNELSKWVGHISDSIVDQLNARRTLFLILKASLDLPTEICPDNLAPVASCMALSWPQIASLRAFHLWRDNTGTKEWPCNYNPVDRCLEWLDVPLSRVKEATGSGLVTFATPSILLWIDQPGQLFSVPSLKGEVVVDISEWLMSGLDLRLFDGLGRAVNDPSVIKQKTRLHNRFRVVLEDAFRRRTLSPRHHLCFDQVIPDERRLLDVRTALDDRGFRINRDVELYRTLDGLGQFIDATRSVGADTLWLAMVVKGQRVKTERQTELPGGQRYTSVFESGELTIDIAGQLPSDSKVLTEEMNALQKALRDRFERLRSNR